MAPAKFTIQDVAKAAGVSVSTVSRVLNDKQDVAPATAVRVRRVIDELGYMSSLAAHSMRSRNTHVIGMLITDLSASFSLEVIRGVGQALQALDYDLIIYSSGRNAGDSEPAWLRKHIARLNSSITDGLIVVAPTTIQAPLGAPIVVVDPCEGSDAPSVISANREGAVAAVEHLIGLGHRRIGFIGGRAGLISAAQRRQGYEEALAAAQIPLVPELTRQGDYTFATGYACAQELLALAQPPTAIFAANDLMAQGVLEAAREAGLNVPHDLSVLGFDDIPEAAGFQPPLTTVVQSIHTMASAATTMLVDLIRGRPLAARQIQVPTRLLVRDSCQASRTVPVTA